MARLVSDSVNVPRRRARAPSPAGSQANRSGLIWMESLYRASGEVLHERLVSVALGLVPAGVGRDVDAAFEPAVRGHLPPGPGQRVVVEEARVVRALELDVQLLLIGEAVVGAVEGSGRGVDDVAGRDLSLRSPGRLPGQGQPHLVEVMPVAGEVDAGIVERTAQQDHFEVAGLGRVTLEQAPVLHAGFLILREVGVGLAHSASHPEAENGRVTVLRYLHGDSLPHA